MNCPKSAIFRSILVKILDLTDIWAANRQKCKKSNIFFRNLLICLNAIINEGAQLILKIDPFFTPIPPISQDPLMIHIFRTARLIGYRVPS